MKQILTDAEIKDILDTEDWYNFPQDAIRAAEQRILEKIGESVATVIESSEYNLAGERPILREVDYYNEVIDKFSAGTPLYTISFLEGE